MSRRGKAVSVGRFALLLGALGLSAAVAGGQEASPATNVTASGAGVTPARDLPRTIGETPASPPREAAPSAAPATPVPVQDPSLRSRVSRLAPDLSPDERTALLAVLRNAYAKPPAEWPTPEIDPGRTFRELGLIVEDTAARAPTHPKALLGLSLFFDVRLSGSLQVSCASCHEPQLGWSNGITFSFGVGRRVIKRHPPTLIGVSQHRAFFWDGRAASLEDQARQVILNPDEMGGLPEQIVHRLQEEKAFYPARFEKAFGDAATTFPRILEAIATFERTLRAGRTRFDAFLQGNAALTDPELAGLHLFRTKARCINCHNGPMFSDEEFHNLGLTYYGRKLQDLGRYDQTKLPADVGRFRTPTLRNVDRTAPYMHNGVFPSLEGVLRLYNAGMARPRPKPEQKDDPLFPKTSEILRPLKLSAQELGDLRAFLVTLSEPPTRVLFPPVPPLPPLSDLALPAGEEPDAP